MKLRERTDWAKITTWDCKRKRLKHKMRYLAIEKERGLRFEGLKERGPQKKLWLIVYKLQNREKKSCPSCWAWGIFREKNTANQEDRSPAAKKLGYDRKRRTKAGNMIRFSVQPDGLMECLTVEAQFKTEKNAKKRNEPFLISFIWRRYSNWKAVCKIKVGNLM